MRTAASVLAMGGLLLGAAVAGDWRQFRGPAANGASPETGLPSTFEGDRSIAWKAALPGRGLSSAIVVGDRVFVTCASGPRQQRLHVVCFRASDGAKLWERQFWATGRTMCQEKTCVAAPSPASDGQYLFALYSSNDLVCLDLEGNLIWLRGLTADYPNASNSLGMTSSLAVADGTVIAQIENDSESFTAGLDAPTGVNRWKLSRPKIANWVSPVVWPGPGGKTLVFLQSNKGSATVEVATGAVRWELKEAASSIPSSTVAGGVLFVPVHGLTAFAADSTGPAPRELWRSGQLRPGTASPLVLGERIFTVNDAGVLTCGAVADGKRLWQLRLKGPISASPVAAENHVYLVSEKGVVQVVDVAKTEGEVTGELDLGATVLSTPAIANGALYVRSDGTLWKLRKP